MQTVLNRLQSIFKYFIYWLLFFQVGRLVFFVITKNHASQFSYTVLGQSMVHGLWLDASIAGYFTLFLGLIMLVGMAAPKVSIKIIKVFHWGVLAISCLTIISNAVLYMYWATPLDYNALKYLETPKEAVASINWLYMTLPIALGVGLYWLFIYLSLWSKLLCTFKKPVGYASYLIQVFMVLFLCGLMIIPIRGGIGIVPVNLSKVYFYNQIYPNQAAYNPVWNILYSFSETSLENTYTFMDEKLALNKFNTLHAYSDSSKRENWIEKRARPNVIIIVLESYLSKLVNLKYKGEEVIPCFNRLTKQGLYFSNVYASGDRSDKGLVAIFSGYPALPKAALVQYPDKFSSIPSIYHDANAAGYETSFYYGGNLDFANLRSYFMSSGVQGIHSDNDFSDTYKRGKWGVHDAYVLADFSKDLKSKKQPFLAGLFTLSNHEPYDLPDAYYFGNRTQDEEYMSAAKYTDSCIGHFIDNFKKSSQWQNTLVVLVADHGVNRLGINEMHDPERFHIPMIWTGGVIFQPQIISRVCSQTDIPKVLLNQCGIKPSKIYKFSNEIDRKETQAFATYFYNNGFGFVMPNCTTIFDNIANKYWNKSCDGNRNGDNGKAYLQVLSKDFSN